jgi:hypothetical protein
MPGKEVVEIRSSAVDVVRQHFNKMETKEIHPPDTSIPRMLYITCLSSNGLNRPTKIANEDTKIIFLIINRRGISPRFNTITGKRKKGMRLAISYLGNEIIVMIKASEIINLVLGSSRWTGVFL